MWAAPTTLAAAATQGSWDPTLVVVSGVQMILVAAATQGKWAPTLVVVSVAPMTSAAVATVVRAVAEVPALELDAVVSVEPMTWAVLVTAVCCDRFLFHVALSFLSA